MKEKAGIDDLRFHDLRRFFNRQILHERLRFTPEEAGQYIGNSAEVNRQHYSPIYADVLEKLFGKKSFTELLKSEIYLN